MFNIYTTKAVAVSCFLITALISTPLVSVYAAQGGGGSSSGGSGAGDQTQDRDRVQDPTTHDGDEPLQDRDQDQLQDRDRDRIQDPTTHDGDEPLQDRDRDRDQLRDPELQIGDEPIQDRDQLRDRLRTYIEDATQSQDRDRLRANTSDGLQEVITASTEIENEAVAKLGEGIRELARNRNRVEVAVMAMIASQNMVGTSGPEIAKLAQELEVAHQIMTQKEEQVQSQSRFRRFFFGGDKEAGSAIQAQIEQNMQRMQRIRERLDECNCNEQVRTILAEQLRNMEEEHTRLQQIAEAEMTRWGLFSWRL